MMGFINHTEENDSTIEMIYEEADLRAREEEREVLRMTETVYDVIDMYEQDWTLNVPGDECGAWTWNENEEKQRNKEGELVSMSVPVMDLGGGPGEKQESINQGARLTKD